MNNAGDTYIISDNHFRHWRINDYCNRKFKSLGHMHEIMIKKWNRTVPKNGKVIILGDIVMTQGGSAEVSEVFKKLNGRKLLVLGNHDRKSHFWYINNGIDFVCDSFVWHWNKSKIMFIHNPAHVPVANLRYYDYIIHGHKHNSSPFISKEGNTLLVNVSVENINYTPMNLSLLLQKLKSPEYLKAAHGIHI